MEALYVVAVDSSVVRHEALFDEYVPLRIRSYSQPLGSGVLRLGDFSTTLLELVVEARSQRLRGVTLTSFARLDPWPEVAVERTQAGSPILSTTFDERRVDDLAVHFKVAVGDEGIVVFWDGLEACEACDCGRVRFLVARGSLAAIWCTQVTQKERELFHTAAGI